MDATSTSNDQFSSGGHDCARICRMEEVRTRPNSVIICGDVEDLPEELLRQILARLEAQTAAVAAKEASS
jgi:hypothetical protein